MTRKSTPLLPVLAWSSSATRRTSLTDLRVSRTRGGEVSHKENVVVLLGDAVKVRTRGRP